MSSDFRFRLNTQEILERLKNTESDVHKVLAYAARELSINARDFIIQKAQKELKGFQRTQFLGENGSHVKWEQISDKIYVVHLDPKAQWIEEGREPTSMATDKWLLKNAKISKDGKRYKVIPITHKSGGVDKGSTELADLINKALKREGINMQEIETDGKGKPKLGVVQKVTVEAPTQNAKNASLFSMPRSAATAKDLGLKQHGGIFHGQNLLITQRKDEKTGKIKKEAMTFRVVHEDHAKEGRWMYPAVQPFNSMEAAFRNAEQEWDRILRDIETGQR